MARKASFEINAHLAGGIAGWALRAAWLDAEAFCELAIAREAVKLPLTMSSTCFRDPNIQVEFTIHSLGESERIERWHDKSGRICFERRGERPSTGTRITINVSDSKAARAIESVLARYSYENDGELVWWQEHSDLYWEIDRVLKPHGLSTDKLDNGKAMLPSAAVDALIALSDRIEPIRRDAIHWQFSGGKRVTSADRPRVAAWLARNFEVGWHFDDQLATRLYEHACPQVMDDFERFVQNDTYRDERWPLALALARRKTERTADIVATLLGKGVNTRGALEALARLPAHKHLVAIRRCLRDANSDARRQAKKTLQKLGETVADPPPAVHLVKKRLPASKGLLKGLAEWSANLDLEELPAELKRLARHIERGFGKTEIEEVLGVADTMHAEQTRTFSFPITANKQSSALWIQLFMDDIDAPDVTVLADAGVIRAMDRDT